jgi:hypothetical protein
MTWLEILGALAFLTFIAGCVFSLWNLLKTDKREVNPFTGEVIDEERLITDHELADLSKMVSTFPDVVRQRAILMDIDLENITPDNLITLGQYAQLIDAVREHQRQKTEEATNYFREKQCGKIREALDSNVS